MMVFLLPEFSFCRPGKGQTLPGQICRPNPGPIWGYQGWGKSCGRSRQ